MFPWMMRTTHCSSSVIYKPYIMPDIVRIDRLKIFLDSMGGGAWPFLVGGDDLSG
jgi:hypothetical protein